MHSFFFSLFVYSWVISKLELFFLRAESEDNSEPEVRVVGVVELDVFPDPADPPVVKGANA
jgi:hypothetical protein